MEKWYNSDYLIFHNRESFKSKIAFKIILGHYLKSYRQIPKQDFSTAALLILLDRMILCHEELSYVGCLTASPLYLLDASSNPQLLQPEMSPDLPNVPWGAKLPLFRTTAFYDVNISINPKREWWEAENIITALYHLL